MFKLLKNNEDPRQTEQVDYLADNFKADGVIIGDHEVEAEAGKDEWI